MRKVILAIILVLFSCQQPETPKADPICMDVCDTLRRHECPEGTFDMCWHPEENTCLGVVSDPSCVKKAKTRLGIKECGIACNY